MSPTINTMQISHSSVVLAGLLMVVGAKAATDKGTVHTDPLDELRFVSVGVGAIPRAVVPSMVQDRAGFIWLGTGDGVVRYDGYRFRPEERESANPLARNLGWVRAMMAARDGRVWLGSETEGLFVYDPRTDRVQLHRGASNASNASDASGESQGDGPGQAPPVAVPVVRALAEDLDGAVWSGSTGGGLQRIDPTTGDVSSWLHGPARGSLPDNRVQALLVDRQGTLWVGTWQGLARRMRGSDRFEPVFSAPAVHGQASLAGMTVQVLYQASDGRIWVGTQQGALAIIDPIDGQGVMLSQPGRASAGGAGSVSSFAEVPHERVWVGRSGGIDIHDLHDGRVLQTLRHDARKPEGLAGDEVTALVVDRAGWIWVAGLGLGLQRHDLNNRTIRVRGGDAQVGSALVQVDVRSIVELDNGEIWTAARGAGIAVLDQTLRLKGLVPAASAGGPLRGEALAQTADGSVWLAAESRLYQFSRDRRLLQRLALDAGEVHRLLAGNDGALWIAAQDGLYRLRPGSARAVRVARRDGTPWVGEVFALAQASDGALWIGTARGLFRIAPGADLLDVVPAKAGAGLGSPVVIGLLLDRDQVLWVDTAIAGLHRMRDWIGGVARFERISERHGIVNHPFGANLLQDARGRIWTQLYVYDPATDKLHELTSIDGVDIGTPWFHAYAKLRGGRMLFGGSKGILAVDAESFDSSTYAPPLVVSDVQVNGRLRRAGQLEQGVTLTPDDRSFSVEFAALDFSDPLRVRYAYQLEGFDPDWLTARSDRRAATYSNLRPGHYLLRVRATNRSGSWSPHELAIAVQVQPAWWQQWWFRVLALMLCAALVFAVVQLRTRQLRWRQAELQAKVRERTAELESLTELLRMESAALQESSLTDPLTGMRNRRFLMRHVDVDVAVSMRRHENHLRQGAAGLDDADLLFFMVDIDHFKEVNDLYGHAAGDAVLTQMRSRLEQVFRDSDYMVRWGGEEFLLVARWITRMHATELAERARRAVADQPFVLDDGHKLQCTCSIGFACFPIAPRFPRLMDWSETINLADAALLLAKTRGRNAWVGVRDAGALTEGQLQARPAPAGWIAEGAITVQMS